jgi:hypothetical protein
MKMKVDQNFLYNFNSEEEEDFSNKSEDEPKFLGEDEDYSEEVEDNNKHNNTSPS